MNDKQVADNALQVLSIGQDFFALEVLFWKTNFGRQGEEMVTSSYGASEF